MHNFQFSTSTKFWSQFYIIYFYYVYSFKFGPSHTVGRVVLNLPKLRRFTWKQNYYVKTQKLSRKASYINEKNKIGELDKILADRQKIIFSSRLPKTD